MRRTIGWTIVVVALSSVGCGDSGSTTSPSSTSETTTTSVASPTTTDVFTGTLQVGATAFFTFDVIVNGTVNATLSSVSGAGVPSTVQLRLGLGTVTDENCTATAFSSSAFAGSTAPVTTTFAPGTYCVSVADVGNLFRPADFSLSVAHS
ncbi:MAG: hypothetical protein ABMA15_24385 [Vicinamibacterales bacterium]